MKSSGYWIDSSQCLGRKIGSIEEVRDAVEDWELARNGLDKKINCQFTTEITRIRLKRLYPSYER